MLFNLIRRYAIMAIRSIREIGVHDGWPWVAIDRAQGVPLDEWLAAGVGDHGLDKRSHAPPAHRAAGARWRPSV